MTLLLASTSSAQESFVLHDLQKPHQVVVDGNDLYVFDEADYSLHVFTLSPLTPRLRIGKKGDGLQEFSCLPYVHVQPESLVFTDFTKTAWFSKDGRFLEAKPYSDFEGLSLDSEILLVPAGERFVLITADHATETRHVCFLDSEFRMLAELYEGPFTWRTSEPIHYRTDTVVRDGLIYVSDTRKGFHIEVFDQDGSHRLTIDKTREVEKVPGRPLLHQYCVSEERIYATTYAKAEDGRTEMWVLDLKGAVLARLYLPLPSIQPRRGVLRYDLFTVDRGRLYEVVENAKTGEWRLLVTELRVQ